jgi:hypothetical protein
MSADNKIRFCGPSGSCITASELQVNKIRLSPSFATADALTDPGDGGVHFPGNSYFATSTGSVGIGTSSPDGKLEIAGNVSSAAWGLNGIQLQGTAATYTDSGALGTRTNGVANSFGIPTFDSTNAVTITNAANVYIAGPPADGGANMTLINAYALWVDDGNSRFDGSLQLEGGTFPATGQGMEILASNGIGYIQMYNRDGASWDDLQINVEDLNVTTTGGYTTFNGGYVGIGGADVSPDATLEIINSGNDDSFLVADDADGDTTPFVIQSNGDVGIGNANPAQKLHVGDGNNPAFPSEGLIRVGASNGAGSYREWGCWDW